MKRRILFGFRSLAVLIFFGVNAPTAQAEVPSLDAVLKACAEKTIVFGRDEKGDLVEVGKTIDGYCKGFLEGMLAVLVHTQTICLKDKNTSADFLLSTVLTYRTATKSQDNDAASVIEAALKRAFNCAK
jgi:hypothetical protein